MSAAHASEDSGTSRLISLKIDGFRGFNKGVTLDFDASAVLIHGPNGSGKTSVFDALQWLFTSEIPRLAPFGLRKTDQYLRNAFSVNGQAVVEAVFRLDNTLLRASRRGDHRASILEVESGDIRTSGNAAERMLASRLAPGSLPLGEVLHTSGLLQQDDLRQILKTKPDERYRQLMRLLGLEVLEQFEQFVRERKTSARSTLVKSQRAYDEAAQRYDAARELLETAELQLQRVTQPADVQATIDRALAPHPQAWRLPEAFPLDRLPDLALEMGRRRAIIVDLRRQLARLPFDFPEDRQSGQQVPEEQLRGARAVVADAQTRLAEARTRRDSAAQVNDSFATMTSAALRLLPDSHGPSPCPVCSSEIDPLSVKQSLTLRSAEGGELAAAGEALAIAQRQHQVATQLLDEIEEAHNRELERQAERRHFEHEFAELVRRIQSLGSADEFGVRAVAQSPVTGAFDSRDLATRRDVVDDYLATLESAAASVESALQLLSQQQAAVRLGVERQSAIPRQRESVSSLRQNLETASSIVDRDRKLATIASTLADGTMSANSAIFRQRFQILEPLMNDVYSRLDPHPAFTHLSFNVESFRAKQTASATVLDAERDISMNPMLIFSSAQANIVVLSAFLALGWAAGNGSLPFVMLDDPLQAMDDVNVLGFADLARHLRRDRQLILATHEARFADLLERKLSGVQQGEDTIIHEFVGWSRGGPEIETTRFAQSEGAAPRVLRA